MSTIEKAVERLAQKNSSQKTEQDSMLSIPEGAQADSEFLLDNNMSSSDDLEVIDSAQVMSEDPNDLIATVDELQANQSEVRQKSIHQLPLAHLESMGLVSIDNPRSQIAEEFRGIKRPLLRNIDGQGAEQVEDANLIMVTSCFQGEGKTFSAINLMLSISMEKDKTVLFVDADVAKASAGKMLGVADDALGLIDVIEHGGVGFEEVILTTNIPNVKIIPTGKADEHSTELLASERMQALMKELSTRYPDRIIIFDSPPFLQTSEASVLASSMGQIMFVVESEKTSPDMINQAVSQIGEDKVIGMVLNKTKRYPWNKQLHGYGYGYGYGSENDRVRVLGNHGG